MSRLWVLVAGVVLAGVAHGAGAGKGKGKSPVPVAPLKPLSIDVVDYVLANGLRVVLSPDAPGSHGAPTVAIAVSYDVGSRDEAEGKAGMVHLIEHLMFQGSKNLGPGDHLALVHAAGGEADAITHTDRAAFFEEVPSHWLERTLWAEADRMGGLTVTREQLDETIGAVLAERVSHQADAYASATALLNRTAFGSFAYGHPVAGSDHDLAAITVDDVNSFLAARYGTSSAVLAVAGDFAEADARRWIDKWFGRIPARERAPSSPSAPTPGSAERRAALTDPLAPSPLLLMAYHTPPAHSPDWYALDLLAAVLGASDGGRLAGHPAAFESVQVGVDLDYLRAEGLLDVAVRVAPGHTLGEVEKLVEQELDKVRTKGVSDGELVRAQRRARAALAAAVGTHAGRAQRLAEHALAWGDPRRLSSEAARYDAVTAEQVRLAAQRFLVPSRRAVVEVMPAGGRP